MACVASTDPAQPGPDERGSGQSGLDLGRHYELDARVALRPEPFGALAYHYGNRRLSFLRLPALVDLVRGLGAHDSLADALAVSGIPASQRPAVEAALAALERAEMIHAR